MTAMTMYVDFYYSYHDKTPYHTASLDALGREPTQAEFSEMAYDFFVAMPETKVIEFTAFDGQYITTTRTAYRDDFDIE